MDIILNGERRAIAEDVTVAELLADIGLDPRKLAVELNLTILPKSQYGGTRLAPGDRLEIVHFVGGG